MTAITPDLLERARGAVLGAAIGDAFGMALEGAPRQHVNAQIREMREGRLPAGHFTSSTGALLTVAEMLMEPQPLEGEELASRLTAWQRPRRPRSASQSPGLLGRLFGRGSQARLGAAPGAEAEVADTEALTRCLPVALINIHDRNACLSQARRLTRVTHQHPDCVAGGAFVAATLWHLLQGMAPRQAVQQALQACGDLSERLAETIRLASTRPREAIVNGDLVEPLLESVIRYLLTTAFFVEAIVRVANLGGNAATAGTLIGALAGATCRVGGIPADWRVKVHGTWPPRGGRLWGQQQLVELADRLLLAPGNDLLAFRQ